MPQYVKNVLLGLDMFWSTCTGGLPGTTLSGRAGSQYLQGKVGGRIFCPLIDIIMHLCGAYPTWRGHCIHAIAGDRARSQAVIKDNA